MAKTDFNIDEKLLSLLVTSVKDYAIFMLDPEGNIISWNEGAKNIKGYSEKEIIGKNMSVFYTPADVAKKEPQHNLGEALKRGSYEAEGLRVRKDGSTFWANVVFTPLYDDDKKLLGYAKVTRDITERKKEEKRKEEINAELERRVREKTEKIIANEQKYRKLIENNHDGIALLDKNLSTIYRSASAERINGWSNAERENMETDDLIFGEDRELVKEIFVKVFANPGEPIAACYRARHKMGHYIWIECLFTNMLDDPIINAIVCNFRDITAKKETDNKLKKTLDNLIENEAGLNKAEAIGKIGSVDIDIKTGKRKWSAGLEEIFGYKHGEVGQTFETFIARVHPDDVTPLLQNVENAFDKLDAVDLEFRVITPDGVLKHVLSRLAISRDINGKAYQANGFMQDITEKKETELNLKITLDELIEHESLLKEAEIIAKMGSVDIDLINQKRRWSEGIDDILGYKKGEIEQNFQTFMDRVHPDDLNELKKEIGLAVEKLDQVDLRYRIITPDNLVKYTHSRLVISRNKAGKAYRAYGFIQDITEMKIAEQSLEKSRIELQNAFDMQTAILDALPPSIALLNARGEIKAVNEAWKKFAVSNNLKTPGYGIGSNYIAISEQATGVDKETGDEIARGIKAVIAGTMKDFVMEYPCDSLNEKRWFQAVVAQLNDKIRTGAVILHINITDRKLAELKLADREMHYRQIVETAQEGIWMMDAELKIVFVNKKMAEMLEYVPSDMIGKYSYDFEENFKKQEAIDPLEQKKLGIKESYETTFISKTGSKIIFYVSTNGLFDNNGKFKGTLAMLTDITERKKEEWKLQELNETLKKHAKELAISNSELEQFAYVASHDLQEPLRMVTSFLSQLEKKYADIIDDKGKQYIHFAVDGAKRMRQIILDLLDFSKVGKTEDDLEEVDLNRLVTEILTFYRRHIEDTQGSVVVQKLPVLTNYRAPLRQVFQNLIGNSFKYHRHGVPSVVEVSFEETRSHYRFAVKDNGIGISSEYFDKIFIIFQRLHNKDQYSGTGMGLAITKKIIENMGGKIWVESEEGKGAAFYFTLPKDNKL